MAWNSIYLDWVMTDRTSYLLELEFGGTLTARGFYPDDIPHSVWSTLFLVVSYLKCMDPLFSNLIPVNGIFRCRCYGCTVLGCDIIPICSLWNGVLFPDCNFLNVQWLLPAMSLPDGTYVHRSRRPPHSCKNHLICVQINCFYYWIGIVTWNHTILYK